MRIFFRQEALEEEAIGNTGNVTEECESQDNSHHFLFSARIALADQLLLWEPWDLERNNKRLIEKLLNEFNKNDIWSMHRDVFMIRLADNWNEQILPHAWSGLVSGRSFWFQCFLTKEKKFRGKGEERKRRQKKCFSVHFRRKL